MNNIKHMPKNFFHENYMESKVLNYKALILAYGFSKDKDLSKQKHIQKNHSQNSNLFFNKLDVIKGGFI